MPVPPPQLLQPKLCLDFAECSLGAKVPPAEITDIENLLANISSAVLSVPGVPEISSHLLLKGSL